jgi:hypothetical protein
MKITEARAAADKPNPHGVSAKPIASARAPPS